LHHEILEIVALALVRLHLLLELVELEFADALLQVGCREGRARPGAPAPGPACAPKGRLVIVVSGLRTSSRWRVRRKPCQSGLIDRYCCAGS